ncbi:MAG: DUF423 domain-containing protein [Pleurocapsa sp.]
MARIFLAIASALGGISVILGAFASHGLKEQLSDRALEIWKTGTQYQMYHALALSLVAVLLMVMETPPTSLTVAGWAFLAGILLFSGSLYALTLTDIKWLGAVTPLGGVAFIIGWGCLLLTAWNN